MPERKEVVTPVKYAYDCDGCGKEMVDSGKRTQEQQPKVIMVCEGCGAAKSLDRPYPYVNFEPLEKPKVVKKPRKKPAKKQ